MSDEPDSERNPILMYHAVSRERGRRFRRFVVTPESFEEQMSYLAAVGFRVCGVSQLAEARAQRSDTRSKLLALTFDDAFQELLPHVVPVLRRHGFGATVYVPTAYIGASSRWLDGIGEGKRAILDADELRELAAAGIECGAHGHTHAALDAMPVEAARIEADMSKKLLEETLGAEVRTFAYPYGYESTAVRKAVAAAGYTSACRVNYAMSPDGEDICALSRLPVWGDWNIGMFGAVVEGRRSLLGRRALSLAWRPLRRGLGRISHIRTAE
jgi:peptidoglycan/xylan/chitin deacetylase (PgdA/CDA1 family)